MYGGEIASTGGAIYIALLVIVIVVLLIAGVLDMIKPKGIDVYGIEDKGK